MAQFVNRALNIQVTGTQALTGLNQILQQNARNIQGLTQLSGQLNTQLQGVSRSTPAYGVLAAQLAQVNAALATAQRELSGMIARAEAGTGTINDMEEAVSKLTEELRNTQVGTQQYTALEARIQSLTARLDPLRQGLNGATVAQRAAAAAAQAQAAAQATATAQAQKMSDRIEILTNFGKGVVGTFGLMQIGAKHFGDELGLSEQDIQRYQTTMLELSAAMAALDGIRAALSLKNVAFVRSLLASAAGMLGFGAATTTAAGATTVFGTALSALSAIGIVAFIAALVVVLYKLTSVFGDARKVQDELNKSLNESISLSIKYSAAASATGRKNTELRRDIVGENEKREIEDLKQRLEVARTKLDNQSKIDQLERQLAAKQLAASNLQLQLARDLAKKEARADLQADTQGLEASVRTNQITGATKSAAAIALQKRYEQRLKEIDEAGSTDELLRLRQERLITHINATNDTKEKLERALSESLASPLPELPQDASFADYQQKVQERKDAEKATFDKLLNTRDELIQYITDRQKKARLSGDDFDPGDGILGKLLEAPPKTAELLKERLEGVLTDLGEISQRRNDKLATARKVFDAEEESDANEHAKEMIRIAQEQAAAKLRAEKAVADKRAELNNAEQALAEKRAAGAKPDETVAAELEVFRQKKALIELQQKLSDPASGNPLRLEALQRKDLAEQLKQQLSEEKQFRLQAADAAVKQYDSSLIERQIANTEKLKQAVADYTSQLDVLDRAGKVKSPLESKNANDAAEAVRRMQDTIKQVGGLDNGVLSLDVPTELVTGDPRKIAASFEKVKELTVSFYRAIEQQQRVLIRDRQAKLEEQLDEETNTKLVAEEKSYKDALALANRQLKITEKTFGAQSPEAKKAADNVESITTEHQTKVTNIVADYTQQRKKLDNDATQDIIANQQSVADHQAAVNAKMLERMQKIAAVVQTFGPQVEQVLFDALANAMDNKLRAIEEKITKAQERLDAVSTQYNDTLERERQLEDEIKQAHDGNYEQVRRQLDAERAQREGLQEGVRKAQQEKAELEKKQQALERERANQQKAQAIAQATIAGAVAAINAYTTPGVGFLTGPIMSGIIAGVTAAQIAVIAGQRFEHGGVNRANGGLAVGPLHTQGGIDMVGRNGAMIGNMEGGEFIVNRRSTSMYLPELKAINEGRNPFQGVRFEAPNVSAVLNSDPLLGLLREIRDKDSNISLTEIDEGLKRVQLIQQRSRLN